MKKSLHFEIIPEPIRYTVQIEPGLLKKHRLLADFLSPLASRFAILTDHSIAKFYGDALCEGLRLQGLEVSLFTFPPGERFKTREMKEALENRLLEAGFGRDSAILALGGGVATDLAGFVAATYCRGIPLILIPTTLLGMVDAAIGGKNGVNTPFGKNLIGSTHQPAAVWIDPEVLQSMPAETLQDGFVEMIKHGLIASAAYFSLLYKEAEKLQALQQPLLIDAIEGSCLIKRDLITSDEKEQGKRRLLNFGHTVGHALEKLSDYTLSHGRAVAIGCVVEAALTLPKTEVDNICSAFKKFGLSLYLPFQTTPAEIVNAMRYDKKAAKGIPRFVLLDTIGKAKAFDGVYCGAIESPILEKTLHWMIDDLCRS